MPISRLYMNSVLRNNSLHRIIGYIIKELYRGLVLYPVVASSTELRIFEPWKCSNQLIITKLSEPSYQNALRRDSGLYIAYRVYPGRIKGPYKQFSDELGFVGT